MPPLPALPPVQLGNLASDISSGAGNLITGLLTARQAAEQRQRQQQQDAMTKALQQAQIANLGSESQARADTAEAERQRIELERAGQATAQSQFAQMYKIHQQEAAAEMLRAQAALRAASARLSAGQQSTLRYQLASAQRNLANLRSLAEQQMQAEARSPGLNALRAQGMAPPHIDYESQIEDAKSEYDNILQMLQSDEGDTPPVSPPPSFSDVRSGASSIHGGAQQPANATPVPTGPKSPLAGAAGGAIKQQVDSAPAAPAENAQSRYNQLRDAGYTPEQARAQIKAEGLAP